MTTYLRQKFKTNLANALAESFSTSSSDNYFLFLGRTQEWPNDDNPPESIDSFDEEVDAWKNMIAMGKLNSPNVIVGAKRYNWQQNVVFDQYDSAVDLYEEGSEKRFYCMTDEMNVYKCLSNNYGSPSVYKPTSTTAEEEITQDGYIWKFMFRVREEMEEFLTSEFIPIENLSNIIYSDDRSLQNNVRISSIPGSIENIIVYQFGGSYPLAIIDDEVGGGDQKHRILLPLSSTQFKLVPLADLERVNGAYNDYYEFYISEGPGAGQKAVISDYIISPTNSSDITITLETPIVGIGSNSVYRIYPRIKITGDGENASAIPVMNTSKSITAIKMVNSGKSYHFANVEVYRKNPTYSNKTLARAIISPISGHGFDPISELGSNILMINVPLSTREGAIINENLKNLLQNEYRQVGILKNAFQNDPNSLVPLGSSEDYSTKMEIENLNCKSTITFTPSLQFCTDIGTCVTFLLSLVSIVLTQGDDNNPFQARGVIDSIDIAQDNDGNILYCTLITSNTNGRFVRSSESDFPIKVFNLIVSSEITAVSTVNAFDNETFNSGDFILGTQSGSTAKVVSWVPNLFGLSGTLKINDIKGKFNSSYFSKVSGNTVLVKGENIVGYSGIDTETGQLVTNSGKLGILKSIYPEVNETKVFYKVTTTLTVVPTSGNLASNLFQINDTVSNRENDTVSGYSEARIIGYTPPSGGNNFAKIEINNISGTFNTNDVLYLVSESGNTITNARISQIDEPEVLSYYGDMLYIQNVQPISTSDDTEEQIKILINF